MLFSLSALPGIFSQANVDRCFALVIRGFYKEAEIFPVLFRSLELYWPLLHWDVIVVLDDDEKDRRMAEIFPGWVTTIYQPFPAHYDRYFTTHQSAGYVWAQAALLMLDFYTEAKYIAFADPDTVLTVQARTDMFFAEVDTLDPRDACRSFRPVVHGMSNEYARSIWGDYQLPNRLLGLTIEAPNFMHNFPIILVREHVTEVREYVIRRVNDIGLVHRLLIATFIELVTPFEDAFFALHVSAAIQFLLGIEGAPLVESCNYQETRDGLGELNQSRTEERCVRQALRQLRNFYSFARRTGAMNRSGQALPSGIDILGKHQISMDVPPRCVRMDYRR